MNIMPGTFTDRDSQGRDMWESWTPVRNSWTDVGSPAVYGRFRVVGRQCFFQALVVPATSVATTAGTSSIDLPMKASGFAGDVSMFDTVTTLSDGTGGIDVANSRAFVPTHGASANNIAVSGWFEV